MNRYDNVHLDMTKLLKEQELKLALHEPNAKSDSDVGVLGRLGARLRLYLTGLLYISGIYKRLIYSNIKLDWFYEFRDYWVNELGNRPIEPHDFYFLSGVYRQKFQDVQLPEAETDEQHLETWQDPRNVYLLFSNHYKLALRPLSVHRFIRYVPRRSRVCEYGCGVAPITTALCRFYPFLDLTISCADIPTLLFHFARWKFRDKRFVRFVKIDSDEDEPLDSDFDVIFCREVLEHLSRPLSVMKHLHSRLKPGGYLVFDYIRSEGKGLDTKAALEDRLSVLKYVVKNFEVVEGHIALDGRSVGTVVCRKA